MENKNQLITKENELLTIDTREVAEMMKINHWEILRKLDGNEKTKGIIPILTDNNFVVSEYFINSTYIDVSGKENKCYLCTKMGCEFLANKFTGEKGILFTAKYVKKFNDMEKVINIPIIKQDSYMIEDPIKRAERWIEERKERQLLEDENKALASEIIEWADTSIINSLVRKYGSSLGNNFGQGWKDFKSQLLYKYSINLNSRITNHMNKTKKKTKPETLSFLYNQEELTKGLKIAIALCKEKDLDISKILNTHMKEIERIDLN